jgi:cell division protein FtsB
VSKHTIYAWKAKYGGMDVSQAQETKQLRDENTRLRKLVADLSLDKDMSAARVRAETELEADARAFRRGVRNEEREGST